MYKDCYARLYRVILSYSSWDILGCKYVLVSVYLNILIVSCSLWDILGYKYILVSNYLNVSTIIVLFILEI